MSSHDNERSTVPGGSGDQGNFGEMLRHAREFRERNAGDLARCLRLEPRVIRALEENAFDQLPAPAYIRGYVRSIAKELGVQSEPLLSALDAQFSRDAPAIADFESRPPRQITSETAIIRYTTAAVVTITLVLIMLWWRGEIESNQDAIEESASMPADIVLEPKSTALEYPFDVIGRDEIPPTFETPVSGGASGLPVTETVTPAVAATTDVNEPTASLSPEITPDQADILISPSADAWVEIRNSAGERLLYELVRPGQDVEVNGSAPFEAIIGNAPAVEIYYRGKRFDLAPYSTDGVARVSLPATE